MGSIHVDPLAGLANALAATGGLRRFVETGTYMGASLPWASKMFERVWTIEINPDYQRQAMLQVGPLPNVKFLLGNSKDHIGRLCGQLDGPALFWLDAHAGAGYFGPNENCPLEELHSVLTSGHDHCILVDDARAFVAPPPPPFDYRKWPSLDEIMGVVLARPGYHVSVITDALIAVPAALRDVVAQYVFAVRPTI